MRAGSQTDLPAAARPASTIAHTIWRDSILHAPHQIPRYCRCASRNRLNRQKSQYAPEISVGVLHVPQERLASANGSVCRDRRWHTAPHEVVHAERKLNTAKVTKDRQQQRQPMPEIRSRGPSSRAASRSSSGSPERTAHQEDDEHGGDSAKTPRRRCDRPIARRSVELQHTHLGRHHQRGEQDRASGRAANRSWRRRSPPRVHSSEIAGCWSRAQRVRNARPQVEPLEQRAVGVAWALGSSRGGSGWPSRGISETETFKPAAHGQQSQQSQRSLPPARQPQRAVGGVRSCGPIPERGLHRRQRQEEREQHEATAARARFHRGRVSYISTRSTCGVERTARVIR